MKQKINKASEQSDDTDQISPDEMDTSGEPAEGVDVPEEFQAAVHKLTKGATKAHLSHMRSKIGDREDALRKEEMESKMPKGKMSMDNAPSSVGDTY